MAEINGWMGIPNSFANLTFAAAGWDSVTLDAQHGLFDERSIVETLQALAAKRPKRLVRTAWNDPALIGKALDAGADGIIAPLISTVEDARRLAAACWYPPRGARSFGPNLAALRASGRPYGEASMDIEVYAMIETREGLERCREIVAVAGVTGLYVGPNDLALSLGLPAGSDREEPEMIAALHRIVAAAEGAKRSCGIFCASVDYARRMADLGFTMVTVASDTGLLAHSAASACAAVRA